jgi:hypothetical protein
MGTFLVAALFIASSRVMGLPVSFPSVRITTAARRNGATAAFADPSKTA